MSVSPEMRAAFRLRYPAMVALPDANADYWLDEAQLVAGSNWPDSIRTKAQFAYAAHMASATGALPDGAIGEGVNSFKSGTFALGLSDQAASRTGYDATVYGREFLAYRAQVFAGPRVYA